ncbi:bifunctional DNA primase/polymerase [Streptomyces sp. NPDC006632]|uniref:bifunctional DNA primase/polymerase n=1 Tax=Streptomyces sp. NPDC006632 TaxID=3157182 RepID=UPI0033A80456
MGSPAPRSSQLRTRARAPREPCPHQPPPRRRPHIGHTPVTRIDVHAAKRDGSSSARVDDEDPQRLWVHDKAPETPKAPLAGRLGYCKAGMGVPAKFERYEKGRSPVRVRDVSAPVPHRRENNTATTRALRATLLASALQYAERGMYVHPLLVGSKEPRWVSWEERATRDPEVIERTWGRAPFNIGIACGPSRLVALDLDLPHDGEVSGSPEIVDGMTMLASLAARTPGTQITPTLTVRTPSGGRHLVYLAPDGISVRNTARTLGFCLDTRAAGGYIVGIGSVVDGAQYLLDSGSPTTPAVLPEWLLALVTAAPTPPKAGGAPRRADVVARLRDMTRQGSREQRWAAGILRSECDELAAMNAGGRNNRLNLAAYRAGQLVAAGLVDQAVAEEHLTEAAQAAGLGVDTPHEIEKTIRSGMAAGLARPRRMGGAA